jgi:hypothetical protein
MLDRRFKSRHLLTQRRACCPGCPEAPSRRLHPGVLAPLPAHLGSSSSPGGGLNFEKIDLPRRCWTGASRAGICLPRDAHAAPGCPEAPSRHLHPGVLPPLAAHLGSSSSPGGGVGNSRKSTSPRRCWTGASRAGICLPRDAHAAPGCLEAPSRRLHPGVLPPLPAHLIELSRGVMQIQGNRPPPDHAGPALQEPASACPETRMLPRAAPRLRAGACTLESSLRCLLTSSSSPVG